MDDLTTWLFGCLAEDERVAMAATDRASAKWKLFDIAAKRRIIELRLAAGATEALHADAWVVLGDVVRLLAAPYANRPGYQESWRP